MLTNYTYRYRLYPTGEQKLLIKKHFDGCRFVWNYFLSRRQMLWETTKTHLSFAQDCALLPHMKKAGFSFLKEVNSQSLQEALVSLDEAHVRAYTGKLDAKARHPRFKRKHSDETLGFCAKQSVSLDVAKSLLRLPKFLEGIPVVLHRPLEGKIKRATVTLNAAGQYHASILVERDIQPLPDNGKAVGVDLGLKTLAVCSDGTVYDNPRVHRAAENRIARLQRSLSRKKKGSSNYRKARLKLAKCHLKAKNRRSDHLHKVSIRIVRESQTICLETLNAAGMVRNRCLAKAISDASLGMLSRMIEAKAKLYGRTVYRVGQFFASSRICSCCGWKNESLTLADRTWECGQCRVLHDRDRNASLNILREGMKQAVGIPAYACGGGASVGERKPASKRFRRSTKPPALAVG